MLRLTLTVAALLASSAAFADRGDVYLDLNLSPQVGWITHPASSTDPYGSPFEPHSMFAIKPGLGLGVRTGLTDQLHLGISLEGAGSTSLTGKGVEVQSTSGDLLTAAYVELAAPVLMGWRFDSGSSLTGVLELQGGPLLTFWGASALVDPDDLDEQGRPAQFPTTIEDSWHVGALVRAQALFEARIWDSFVFAVGPSLGVSWADTVGVHVGLTLRPSFAFGSAL